MLNLIATWRRERETIRLLARLSERELADIGIAREDFATVARSAVGGRTFISAARGELPDAMAPSWGQHNRRALAA